MSTTKSSDSKPFAADLAEAVLRLNGANSADSMHYAIIIIQVKVKPNSRVSTFEQAEGGTWLARLKSAPIDGKANKELMALVASHFQCRVSAVTVKSGASGRMKLVLIQMP